MNIVTPITLEGTIVRLVPMSRDVAKDAVDDIFRWIP
jgi:hypothetical protein